MNFLFFMTLFNNDLFSFTLLLEYSSNTYNCNSFIAFFKYLNIQDL